MPAAIAHLSVLRNVKSIRPFLILGFWTGFVLFGLGQVITFRPGAKTVWFVTSAGLCLYGFLLRARTYNVAAFFFVTAGIALSLWCIARHTPQQGTDTLVTRRPKSSGANADGAILLASSGAQGGPYRSWLSLRQMGTRKSCLPTLRSAGLLVANLTAILVLSLSGSGCSKTSPIPPVAFGHLAVPTATNANFVGVAISNQSDCAVFYLACPVQVRTNGVWRGAPLPPRQRLTRLVARQAGVLVVEAAAAKENARVPVLWGFDDYTAGANRFQQVLEDLRARVRGRDGVGLLYTNYLTELKL